ncbi:hypothetical protein [Streptomyces sp. NPDC093094]|uniref:hypothetical protein n=1 Tax=Streptomyces sp. NPDC093094 TaxID=3366026 RepID=UPI0037F3A904
MEDKTVDAENLLLIIAAVMCTTVRLAARGSAFTAPPIGIVLNALCRCGTLGATDGRGEEVDLVECCRTVGKRAL